MIYNYTASSLAVKILERTSTSSMDNNQFNNYDNNSNRNNGGPGNGDKGGNGKWGQTGRGVKRAEGSGRALMRNAGSPLPSLSSTFLLPPCVSMGLEYLRVRRASAGSQGSQALAIAS